MSARSTTASLGRDDGSRGGMSTLCNEAGEESARMATQTGTKQQPSTKPAPKGRRPLRGREDMRATWVAYKETGDPALRNELVEAYLFLVRRIGNRVAARLPRSIDVQDLRSAGTFGLMRAIENFDIDKGTPFESYGALRVRGAILDELRAQDWVPRLVRHRTSLYRKTTEALRDELGREPMTDEVALRLEMPLADVEVMRRESNLTTVYTLSPQEERDDDPRLLRKLDALMDRGSEMPLEHLVASDLAASLVQVLGERERMVIALYYVEGLTMREIGSVLKVSESRVCQIHTKCLSTLRDHLLAEEATAVLPEYPTPRWARN